MKINNFITLTLLFLFSSGISIYADLQQIPRKKMLIWTCGGGGGHISASNAITGALNNDYDVIVVDPFTEIFNFFPFNTVKKFTFNKYSGLDFYNSMLKSQWNRTINKFSQYISYWIKTHNKKMLNAVMQYLKQENPDMVISVIPYVNGVILEAAEKLNISFLAIPTDLNTETFVYGIKSPKYKKFIYSLPFDDPLLLKKIESADIPQDSLRFLGLPLRPDFFEKKDIKKIKKEFSLPSNKPVVMILMGAVGSNALYSLVNNLALNKFPIHLVVCAGRNGKIKEKLEKIKLPTHITMQIFGFTNKISDLMAASNLIITKPGGQSVCEAIQMKTPMIIYEAGVPLQWEKTNTDFIKKHELGDTIKDLKKINLVLERFLNDSTYIETVKRSSMKLKRESFSKPLQELVGEMLKK